MSSDNTEAAFWSTIKAMVDDDITDDNDITTSTSNTPSLRTLISDAEEVTKDMTKQVRELLQHEYSSKQEHLKMQSKGRPPPHPASWVTPRTLKDINVAIIGLGHIGAPLTDLLARSGLRRFILFDKGMVRQSDIVCDVYKPSMVGHSKVQACQLNLFRLDRTLHVEAYVLDITKQEDVERFHRCLLAPGFTTPGSHKINIGVGGGGGRGRGNDDLFNTGGGGAVASMEKFIDVDKRKKIDLVLCCCARTEARGSIFSVCKSLNIPMVAMRVLGGQGKGNISNKEQGTIEFVLPRESRLYEPKLTAQQKELEAVRKETERLSPKDSSSRRRGRNGGSGGDGSGGGGGSGMEGFDAVSNKVQPLGLALCGIGLNIILKIIRGKEVPSFLRYDLSNGETSTRLPRRD